MTATMKAIPVSEVVSSVFSASIETVRLDTFRPLAIPVRGTPEQGIPTSIDELPEHVIHCYDMTVTAAVQLNIPVVGSIGGGLNRRVVVGEVCYFKRITENDVERQYGFAIRMCITVDKWNADLKVNLPFLAASAQLGMIEAQWLFQVVGLAGPKVDVNLPPAKLDVETFVLAQQSFDKILSAIRDPTTKFLVSIIGETKPIDKVDKELRMSAVRSYGLGSIEKGRTLEAARQRLHADATDEDTLQDVYKTVAGLTDPLEEPVDTAKRKASDLLGRIRADV